MNPKSTSNQSSKPCTVLQYPSKKVCLHNGMCHHNTTHIFMFICIMRLPMQMDDMTYFDSWHMYMYTYEHVCLHNEAHKGFRHVTYPNEIDCFPCVDFIHESFRYTMYIHIYIYVCTYTYIYICTWMNGTSIYICTWIKSIQGRHMHAHIHTPTQSKRNLQIIIFGSCTYCHAIQRNSLCDSFRICSLSLFFCP